jgi:hypothetical protein
METIKIKNYFEIPKGFTGIAEYYNGSKLWYRNGKQHREDGPAIEYPDGGKDWFLNGIAIYALGPIGDYILIEDGLSSDVEWLGELVTQRKVLTSDGIVYLPNLPGL